MTLDPEDFEQAQESQRRAGWRKLLVFKSKGKLAPNVANAILVLRNTVWGNILAWDDFSQCVRLLGTPPWDPTELQEAAADGAELTDPDVARLAAWLVRNEKLDVGTDLLWKALAVVAEGNRVHPDREWLHTLTWDGTPRLSTWLQAYLGASPADDDPKVEEGRTRYLQMVGRMFMVGAVARVMKPGCKVDTMMVLEGRQGAGKSSAIRILFGDAWTCDTPLDFASKDRFVQLRGKWAQEIAELDGMERADVGRIKGFLSSPVDEFRPPFGRGVVRYPRQVVMVGTVNPGASGYLRDVTGNRRFWPVVVGRIDRAALERDREQLWAEALQEYLDGRPWWPSEDVRDLFHDEQSQRVASDVWEDRIGSMLEDPTREFITISDVLTSMGIVLADQDQAKQNRAARALLKLGRERVRRRIGGRYQWGYAAPCLPADARNDPSDPSIENVLGSEFL